MNDSELQEITTEHWDNITFMNMDYSELDEIWLEKWHKTKTKMGYAIHKEVIYYLNLALGCPGIILNVLTLIVLFRMKYRELGPYLILLKSLAFADLLVCFLTVLKTTLKVGNVQNEPFLTTCLKYAIFDQCSFAYVATLLTLILIAVAQYIAVAEPLRHNKLVTGRRLGAAVFAIWTNSFLISSIDLFKAFILTQLDDGSIETFCRKLGRSTDFRAYVFTFMVFIGLISLSVIYIKIFIAARSSLKSSEALTPSINQQRKTRRHSLYTSLMLLGTFLMVYVPYCGICVAQEVNRHWLRKLADTLNRLPFATSIISQDAGVYQETAVRLDLIRDYMDSILVVNAICDPLIYVVRMDSMKKIYRNLCCRFCQKNPVNV